MSLPLIIIFKKDYNKKKRTFGWIRLNPETTWSAELKIKGSKNWPLRRQEKSKQTLTGIKGRVPVRVTWCRPPGQAGLGAADSAGGAQSGTKIATALTQRGIKKFVKSQERGRRRRREGGGRTVLTAVAGAAHFFRRGALPPAGRIADFQLCADMFPSSAHINDTLVSIVTKGE